MLEGEKRGFEECGAGWGMGWATNYVQLSG